MSESSCMRKFSPRYASPHALSLPTQRSSWISHELVVAFVTIFGLTPGRDMELWSSTSAFLVILLDGISPPSTEMAVMVNDTEHERRR
ncbi:hypothetical protein Hypma_012083 [Hypsizygus marmoreus]|uniref:Uncharacterized protein n=1 Tax=Hypsizygus marmoreus TaxID=39966 RepID=A0A369JHG3_HYPMA|nr:hypothetical protein Hypma_012083 [Hypsizygus marmoreus]